MQLDSHVVIFPSASNPTLNPTAPAKKRASRRNDLRLILNGFTIAIDPATTDVIKNAAPMSSPIARLPEPTLIAENVEKRSGEPLPRARKVTPAIDSDNRRLWARVARLGQRKSLAAMPMAVNNKLSQNIYVSDGELDKGQTMRKKPIGLTLPKEQK
jgi:hypothetical protein